MNNRIGFIGCGNMGGALPKAAAKSDLITPAQICIADKNTAQAEKMAEVLGGAVVGTNKDVAKYCNYIFLAVKPQMMAAALEEIAPILKAREDRFVLVTIA